MAEDQGKRSDGVPANENKLQGARFVFKHIYEKRKQNIFDPPPHDRDYFAFVTAGKIEANDTPKCLVILSEGPAGGATNLHQPPTQGHG